MATRKNSRLLVPSSALILNGQRLEVSPERAEYTRLLKRFTGLAVTQRTAAAETLDGFSEDVDSFCVNADEWAHKYIDVVADLAVEELIAKGCLDVDRSAFISDYLNTCLWDKRIGSLRALVKELNEEESERESRRQDRTESARHIFDDDYDDEKVMNLASAGVSGIFNAIGRSMASSEMKEKIKTKFEEDREAYLRAIYMTIRTSVDEFVTCLSEKGKCDADGGVSQEAREKAERLFNNLSGTHMAADVAEKVKLEILQLDPYKQEFYDWCFLKYGDPSGELEKIAEFFGVSLERVKSEKFVLEVGECDYASEEVTQAYKAKAVALAESLRCDASEKLAEIDEKLTEFDRIARTVDGREFKTRDEAVKQRELSKYEKGLSVETEDEALSSMNKLKAKIKSLRVDGDWKLLRIEDAIRHFDELARTVDDRVFETRDEATKQRELSQFESVQDLSTEEAAKQSRQNIVTKISALKIDGSWKLERVDAALKRFDELARTTFGILFETRDEASDARGNKDLFYRGVCALAERSGENAFYFEGVLPAKKLANAQKCFPIPTGERVLCLTDTTFFGSGKTGLAITECGLRWANGKSVASGKTFLTWKEFSSVKEPPRRLRGENMILGENAVYDNGGSNVDDKKMGECLVELYGFCQQATFDFADCTRPIVETPDSSGGANPFKSAGLSGLVGKASGFVNAFGHKRS